MKYETEGNGHRLELVADASTKRPWHAPEIEELDFGATQNLPAFGSDSPLSGS
jgi:hypothetical protein